MMSYPMWRPKPVNNQSKPYENVVTTSNESSKPPVTLPLLSPPTAPTAVRPSLDLFQSPLQTPRLPLQPLVFSQNEQLLDLGNCLFNRRGHQNLLRGKFQQNNNILTINNEKYFCQEKDFRYIEELGSGSCGVVIKMEHIPSRSILAVKQMRTSGEEEDNMRIVMDLDVLLKGQDCEHIVECHGYLIKSTEVWIFMELMFTCMEKLLRKVGKPFPEEICGKIALATVKALNYLKDNHSVMHRDVKPSNILINGKGVVKLCDFGISGSLVNSVIENRHSGCSAYLAPERIDPPDPSKPLYDVRADVWSLGISMLELAIGYFPYSGCKADFEILSTISLKNPPSLPLSLKYSLDFRNFIKTCLQKDFNKRPKYHQLLKHPFILKYERKNVDVQKWLFTSLSRPC